MISDPELLKLIDEKVTGYKGDITYLNEAVGMVVVGRLIGWEHQRMVTSRKCWTFATKLFGMDMKSPELMPKRGKLAKQSGALAIADSIGGYLAYIKGTVTLSPKERAERKTMTTG